MTAGDGEFSRGRIVVGVDGSDSSINALNWAKRIGAAIDVPIDAVTSWEYPTSYGMAVADGYRPDLEATKSLANALTTAFGAHPPIDLRTRVVEGHPASVLKNESRHSEMLVVGSRGHGGFAGLLLGSVSTSCAQYAGCPVVVVHS